MPGNADSGSLEFEKVSLTDARKALEETGPAAYAGSEGCAWSGVCRQPDVSLLKLWVTLAKVHRSGDRATRLPSRRQRLPRV